MTRILARDDSEYCRGRAIQEDVAAEKATCRAARERHEEMADMYRLRMAMLRPNAPSWLHQVADAAEQPRQAEEVDLLAD